MALHKTLLKKRFKYSHPLPPKTSYCDKTIGSRELIFGTIHIKKCMNNLEFFQPNLRWSSGEFSINCHVWRGMTQHWVRLILPSPCSLTGQVYFWPAWLLCKYNSFLDQLFTWINNQLLFLKRTTVFALEEQSMTIKGLTSSRVLNRRMSLQASCSLWRCSSVLEWTMRGSFSSSTSSSGLYASAHTVKHDNIHKSCGRKITHRYKRLN